MSVVFQSLLLLVGTTPEPLQSVQLIGFSHNEKVAAWRVDVAQPRDDGHVDFYSLFEVVDSASGSNVASFRGSRIKRTHPAGLSERVGQKMLIAENPRFESAESKSGWKKMKRRARFSERAVPLDCDAVRLIADDDVSLQGRADRDAIQVRGGIGDAVGFAVVARQRDGERVQVGHFRHEAIAGAAIIAEIRAHVSKSGRSVAVVTTFSIEDNGMVLSTMESAVGRLTSPLDLRQKKPDLRPLPNDPHGTVLPWAGSRGVYNRYVGGYGRGNGEETFGEDETGWGLEPDSDTNFSEYIGDEIYW